MSEINKTETGTTEDAQVNETTEQQATQASIEEKGEVKAQKAVEPKKFDKKKAIIAGSIIAALGGMQYVSSTKAEMAIEGAVEKLKENPDLNVSLQYDSGLFSGKGQIAFSDKQGGPENIIKIESSSNPFGSTIEMVLDEDASKKVIKQGNNPLMTVSVSAPLLGGVSGSGKISDFKTSDGLVDFSGVSFEGEQSMSGKGRFDLYVQSIKVNNPFLFASTNNTHFNIDAEEATEDSTFGTITVNSENTNVILPLMDSTYKAKKLSFSMVDHENKDKVSLVFKSDVSDVNLITGGNGVGIQKARLDVDLQDMPKSWVGGDIQQIPMGQMINGRINELYAKFDDGETVLLKSKLEAFTDPAQGEVVKAKDLDVYATKNLMQTIGAAVGFGESSVKPSDFPEKGMYHYYSKELQL